MLKTDSTFEYQFSPQDPHDELKNQNVLIERGGVQQTAEKFGLTEECVCGTLRACREKLFEEKHDLDLI